MEGGDQYSTTFGSGLADTRVGCIRGHSLLTCIVLFHFPSEIVLVVGPFTICTSQSSSYLGSNMLVAGDASHTASPVLKEGGEAC